MTSDVILTETEVIRDMTETIELQLNKQTLERARQLATFRHCTLEELITEMLEQVGRTKTGNRI